MCPLQGWCYLPQDSIGTWLSFIDILITKGENKTNKLCLVHGKHSRERWLLLILFFGALFVIDLGAAQPVVQTKIVPAGLFLSSLLCPSLFCFIICMPVVLLKSKSASWFWFLQLFSPKKEAGLLGETADPRLGQEVDQIRQASGARLGWRNQLWKHAEANSSKARTSCKIPRQHLKQHFTKISRSSNWTGTMAQWQVAISSTEGVF